MAPPIQKTWPVPIRFPISRQVAPGPEFFQPETKPKFRPVSPLRDQISKIVRRTGRVNAGLSRKVSGIRDSRDCLVAHAVQCEPVSTPNSLLAGNRTGKFAFFDHGYGFRRPIFACKFRGFPSNSLRNGTGNYFGGAANFAHRSGIFPSQTKFVGC